MDDIQSSRHRPIVAIVGRPNVGKSTLFNRIVGKRKAVVHDMPGMTRDRNYHAAGWRDREFLLVDTGGYELQTGDQIYKLMREQTMMAIEEADVIIFLLDTSESNNPTDDQVMTLLRKTRKPVLVAVNKADNDAALMTVVSEFSRFGVDRVYGVSAMHGTGTGDLLDAVYDALPPEPEDGGPDDSLGIRVAVIGHPNVGKSTLVNKILGFERTIASPVAGTTRDSIDTTFERDGQRYTLIDTAGIRRKGKVDRGAEKLSVMSSLASLERCDIAVIVIDAEQGLTDQDAHVAGYAVDAGCGCIIVMNKWDAVEKDGKTADETTQKLRDALGFLRFAPILYASAKTGQRVDKLFKMIGEVYEQYTREIDTRALNEFLQKTLAYLSPPMRSGKQLRIKYVTQTGTRPPTFTFFVNDPGLIHFSYERYLLNQLRREFGFEGVPVKLRYKEKGDPKWSPR
ncbi:MAG: ribosome biogenesis GTPase Der [Candidatus Sumerlaeaceae bacterium]|nr:ribosome biogenesis GTPase Der [Candidatus Sumerlaeaceae bacterium]